MRYFRTAAVVASMALSAAVPDAWAGAGHASAAPVVIQVPGDPVVVQPGETGLALATCPRGTTSTGGGATVDEDNGDGVLLVGSAPVGHAWRVRAHNRTQETRTLRPKAICTNDTITQVDGQEVEIRRGESLSADASCNPKFTAGGGGDAGDETYLSLSDGLTVQWLVRAKNLSPSLQPMQAFVRCSATLHNRKEGDRVTLEAGQAGTAHVECDEGQVPTAGGGLGNANVLFNVSSPTEKGWTLRATNTDSVPHRMAASVLCTTP